LGAAELTVAGVVVAARVLLKPARQTRSLRVAEEVEVAKVRAVALDKGVTVEPQLAHKVLP
jgi:hypothetical protein